MATTGELMDEARSKLEANAALAAQIDAVFKFVLTGEDGGTYLWRMKDPPAILTGDGEADCTLTMSAEDYAAMREGRANAQELFFAQRLRVDGDLGLAMKLQALNELVG